MTKAALVYSTKYGQTEKIVNYISKKLKDAGLENDVFNLEKGNDPNPHDYDSFIVASPIFIGNFSKKVINWIKANLPILKRKESSFFFVCMNAADPSSEARDADSMLRKKFVKLTLWSPKLLTSFAGAIDYPAYNWLIRLILKRISKQAGGSIDTSKCHEYTEWKMVDQFVNSFLARLSSDVAIHK